MMFDKTIPLNEFITLQRGFDLPKSKRQEGSIPIIASTCVTGYHNEAKVKAPGVVIGRSGSIGGGQYIEEDYWPLNTSLWVKDFKGHYPKYVYYLMKSIDFSGFNVGTGVPTLNRNHLSSLLVADIGYEKEKEIAEALSSLDNKISNNTAMNATLEKIAQRIFKSWFVDFDPVKANAEDVTSDGLSPEIQALFPNEFEESELGMIPKGWEAVNFGSQLIHTIGGDWGKEVLDEKHTENVRIIRGTDFNNLLKGNDSAVPTRFVEAKKLKTRKLESNDIIIEVSGGSPTQPTGRSMRISEDVLDLLALPVEPASFCRLFRPASAEVSTLLSHHLTRLYNEGGTWKYQNQSTGISNFQTKYFLENELVVMPSEDILRQFHKTIKPIVNKISLNGSQINSLSKIRDKLLPRLISGKITIQKSEELLEEAS